MSSDSTTRPIPLSIVIADDHADFREALCMFLQLEDDFQIIEQTGDWDRLEQVVHNSKPDIVLLDISMPSSSGVRDGLIATRELLRKHPETPILLLSMFDDIYLCRRAFAAGAKGYFLKDCDVKKIIRAMRAIASGLYVCDSNSCNTLSYRDYFTPVLTYMRTPAS